MSAVIDQFPQRSHRATTRPANDDTPEYALLVPWGLSARVAFGDDDAAQVRGARAISGVQAVPDLAVYAATRAFALSFSEALVEDVRGTDVRVTALCPYRRDRAGHRIMGCPRRRRPGPPACVAGASIPMSAPVPAAPPPSLWPAVGLGLGVAIANGFARFAYALVLPAMRQDLGWTYAQAGWLNTANAIGYVIGATSGYVLLRQARPSQLFTLGLALTVLSVTLTGLGSALAWLTLTRIGAGVGAAWVFACGGALVASRFQGHPALLGKATGLYFGGGGLGIVTSGLLVNPLLAVRGAAAWPWAWIALGVVAMAAAVWPVAEARRISGSGNAVTAERLRLHALWPSLVGYFLFGCGYIAYMTFVFAWVRGEAMSWQFGTVVWSVLGVAVAASPFVWRRALDRWHPAVTLSTSCAVNGLGSLVPLLLPNAVGILVSATLVGLAMFIAPSAVAVLSRRSMMPALWAKAIILFTVVFSVGQAIGPVFAGWIADHAGLGWSLAYGAGVLALGSLVALIGLGKAAARMARTAAAS
jgi:MFS family permease